MPKHIKEIEHNGETYYALSSIIEILEISNDLTHFDILLFADDEEYKLNTDEEYQISKHEEYQLNKDDKIYPDDDFPCDDISPFES